MAKRIVITLFFVLALASSAAAQEKFYIYTSSKSDVALDPDTKKLLKSKAAAIVASEGQVPVFDRTGVLKSIAIVTKFDIKNIEYQLPNRAEQHIADYIENEGYRTGNEWRRAGDTTAQTAVSLGDRVHPALGAGVAIILAPRIESEAEKRAIKAEVNGIRAADEKREEIVVDKIIVTILLQRYELVKKEWQPQSPVAFEATYFVLSTLHNGLLVRRTARVNQDNAKGEVLLRKDWQDHLVTLAAEKEMTVQTTKEQKRNEK